LLSHNITTKHLKEQEREKKRNQQKGPTLLVPENMSNSQPQSRQLKIKGMVEDDKNKKNYEYIEPIHKSIQLKNGVQYIKSTRMLPKLNREESNISFMDKSEYFSKFSGSQHQSKILSRKY
jgi:hypothetical protein